MAISLPAVGVRFRAEGDAAVVAAVKRVEGAATQSGRVIGNIGLSAEAARGKSITAAQGIANAMETVARTGNTGGEAIRQMVTQVGNLAFAFGVGGPLTAAVGVAGLAIVQMLTNARNRTRELIAEINRARQSTALLAVEEANKQVAEIDARVEVLQKALKRREVASERTELDNLLDARAKAQLTARERLTDAAIAQAKVLRQLKEAGQATAQELNELAAIESSLGQKVKEGTLTLAQRVELLPPKQKEVKQATEDTSKAFDAQVTALLSLADQGRLTLETYQQLRGAQAALSIVVAQGTGTLQDQVKAWEQLQKVQRAASLPGLSVGRGTGRAVSDGTGKPAAKLSADSLRQTINPLAEEIARRQDVISESISSMLADGIAAGFSRAIESGSIAQGFDALTKSFMSSLGAMLTTIGQQALKALLLESTVVKAIASLNPAVGIPAAVALIALGGSLSGARARGGSATSGGGGLGGSTSRTDNAVTRLTVRGGVSRSVSPQAPVVVNATLLNPNDPASQRLLMQAIRPAMSRGY